MNRRRFVRLIVMLAVGNVLLNLPRIVFAHHGIEGIAAGIIVDAALNNSSGCGFGPQADQQAMDEMG